MRPIDRSQLQKDQLILLKRIDLRENRITDSRYIKVQAENLRSVASRNYDKGIEGIDFYYEMFVLDPESKTEILLEGETFLDLTVNQDEDDILW